VGLLVKMQLDSIYSSSTKQPHLNHIGDGRSGLIKRKQNQVSHTSMRSLIYFKTHMYVCAIWSSTYFKAISPIHLEAAFRKVGMYLYHSNVNDPSGP